MNDFGSLLLSILPHVFHMIFTYLGMRVRVGGIEYAWGNSRLMRCLNQNK